MQESIVFLLRVQCRRKESSRSLSHLLISFLYIIVFWYCLCAVDFSAISRCTCSAGLSRRFVKRLGFKVLKKNL